jgi:succinyl-diaminopimelate desuccinylase
MTDTDALKRQVLQWIEDESVALVDFLARFVRAASPNPPGDTRAAADHASAFLQARALPFSIVAPQAEMPNVVGTFGCAEAGRHLALNGHIDVYPVTDAEGWHRPPFGGEIADGRVHGRGAADMKCGTTASLAAYSYLHRLRGSLRGRVSLSVVSDEESGGRWGTEYLMQHHPELIGDCCLNGEPGSPHLVRIGEKGPLWARFTVGGSAGHGGYPIPGSGAIANAARLIVDLERVTRLAPSTPPSLAAALEQARGAMERGLGAGAVETVQAVTLNVGTIRGGTKISLRATECVFNADIRLPIGIGKPALMNELQAILARHPETRMEELIYAAPNMSDPEGEMAGIIQDNVEQLRGFRPPPAVSIGGSDARFWRYRGIPAYIYGPTPAGVGGSNEFVAIDEFLHVVRTHALSAIDYLARPALTLRD